MGFDKKVLDRLITAADPQDHKSSARFATAEALTPYAASIQETVKVDPTTAIGTVTLPTAVGFAGFQIKVVSISDAILPFVVTIDTTSGQLINGVLTKTLTTAREFLIVESDNVGWLIVG